MNTATSARREAVLRLIGICEGPWDVDVLLSHGSAVDVLIRKALRIALDDELLLAEVRALAPVAKGRTEPLIDAALRGLPDQEMYRPHEPAWNVDDLKEALA